MLARLIVFVALTLHTSCIDDVHAIPTWPFLNTSLSWSERVDDLVARMTLPELISQMASYGTGPLAAIPRLGIKPYNFNNDCLHGVENPNKGTAFPQSIGLSATFSPDLIYTMATVISTEMRAIHGYDMAHGDYTLESGINCWSPMINIMRHPLWGRVQETYGEDPFLTGRMAAEFVRGLQGDHPRYVRASAGCKHFAVHSGPEDLPSSRFSFDSKVSERDMRLTFLPQFKQCIEAGTLSLMCSYNSINGIPACANRRMLTDIAREEFGFRGYVISDDGAIQFIVRAHHYANTSLDAVSMAVNAGVNMEMPWDPTPWFPQLYDAVAKGMVSYETILERVRPILYSRMRFGEFDPDEVNPYAHIDMSVVQSSTHRHLALWASIRSLVLLKNNNNTLPIRAGSVKHIAILGPMADNAADQFGTYTPAVDPRYTSTVYSGLQGVAATVTLTPGCDNNRCNNYNADAVKNATMAADLVIVCLGLGAALEEEDTDRPDMSLPGYQQRLLLDAMMYANQPVILLLFAAGPLDVVLAQDSTAVGAIIQCFYPAQSTGVALRQVLFEADGLVVSPAGRLPYTWPRTMDQIPPMVNYSMAGRTYRYFTWPAPPLYPFGYGLAFSQFHYSDLAVQPATVKAGDNITVDVTITNLGPYACDEVTQVYVSWRDCPVEMPLRQLVAVYRSLLLEVGESRSIQLAFKSDQLQVWDDKHGFMLISGVVDVYVGGQQPDQSTTVGSNILHTVLTTVTDMS